MLAAAPVHRGTAAASRSLGQRGDYSIPLPILEEAAFRFYEKHDFRGCYDCEYSRSYRPTYWGTPEPGYSECELTGDFNAGCPDCACYDEALESDEVWEYAAEMILDGVEYVNQYMTEEEQEVFINEFYNEAISD